MKKITFLLTLFLETFSVKAQENVNISFSNDLNEPYHLSLIIYTPDGKIQTRVSDLSPDQVKSYDLPMKTEIFIADSKQEVFAMKGNDIKSTGVNPFIVLSEPDYKRTVKLSSIKQGEK
ncbi:MAG: hypothetical protein RLZZ30_1418 [Bacteroidota bacterium]|jgi:hypothetical protein